MTKKNTKNKIIRNKLMTEKTNIDIKTNTTDKKEITD